VVRLQTVGQFFTRSIIPRCGYKGLDLNQVALNHKIKRRENRLNSSKIHPNRTIRAIAAVAAKNTRTAHQYLKTIKANTPSLTSGGEFNDRDPYGAETAA